MMLSSTTKIQQNQYKDYLQKRGCGRGVWLGCCGGRPAFAIIITLLFTNITQNSNTKKGRLARSLFRKKNLTRISCIFPNKIMHAARLACLNEWFANTNLKPLAPFQKATRHPTEQAVLGCSKQADHTQNAAHQAKQKAFTTGNNKENNEHQPCPTPTKLASLLLL